MKHLVLFVFLLGPLLIPGHLQAATPRIEVVAPRSGFTLSRVTASFAVDLRERDGRASAAATRYRVRIADREGGRGWDSGWIAAAPIALGDRLRFHVDCGLDTTGAVAVSELHVDVALEVDGVIQGPWRVTFYSWADDHFRPFPEPQPWPEPIRATPLDLG